jgi:hypothetical protein
MLFLMSSSALAAEATETLGPYIPPITAEPKTSTGINNRERRL